MSQKHFLNSTPVFLKKTAEKLKKLAEVVVVDGYFSKEPFVSKLTSCGLDVISRFSDDVRLRYIIQVKKTGKRGRTKTNGEALDLANVKEVKLDLMFFQIHKNASGNKSLHPQYACDRKG